MPAVERSEISQDQLNSAEQSPGRELNLLDIFESAGLLNRDRAAERPSNRAYQGLDDEGKDEARGRERRESRQELERLRVEAKDPRTDPSRLDRLAEDRRPELRSVVAGNQNTRPETLLRLAGDPDWRVRSDLASNPATTLDALEQLVNDPDQRVRESLAANANLSPEQLERLAADESWTVRRLIAQREDLSPELLRRLAQSPEPLVGAAVAANLNTPVDALESLAERRELLIDMALARNPHIRARAGDPQANPAVLRALAYHASPDIARQVAANPNTGLRELAFLFRRESLSESVLNNPALNRLSGSHEGLINQELANYAGLSDRDRDDLYRRIQSEFKFLEEMRRLRDARRRH